MFYAIHLDQFLSEMQSGNVFHLEEVGRSYRAVLVKCAVRPAKLSPIDLTEEEANAWAFVDVRPEVEKITVRPDNRVYDLLKDRGLEQVPQTLKSTGEVIEGVIKYKYTLTVEDRNNAAKLREKIQGFIPYDDYAKD